MSKFCPFCGEELVNEAKFCKNCGKDISSYTNIGNGQSAGGSYTPQVSENSHTLALVLGILSAIFIPIIGLIFGIYLVTRKDNPNAKTYGIVVIALSVVVWFISFIITSTFMYY